MKNYLEIAPKYLLVHKRKTRLTILSVVIAVALVAGIFSMLDALVKFERTQILKSEGNYHILIRNPLPREISFLQNRIDIENSGMLSDLGEGDLNGKPCALASIDENFEKNINIELIAGHSPKQADEMMLEQWYMDRNGLKIGDTVTVVLPDGTRSMKIITGGIRDWGATKAASIPFGLLSPSAAKQLKPVASQYFILFKKGIRIQEAKADIAKTLELRSDRIGSNEGLLALMLQTQNNRVLKFYAIGAVLFALVLMTAVIMIYNTFNLSVMDRIRQFGLLRCVGASKAQIIRLVRRESLLLSLKAIPWGVLGGLLMTVACLAVLKFYNRVLFQDISIFYVSIVGIGAGVLVGFLSVLMASMIPARKAAGVAPAKAAIAGSLDQINSKKRKTGFLTTIIPVETAMGIGNALNKKRTLFLMSSSIAISIVLFLGFSVLVNPAFIGINTTKSYTADLSLRSDSGINPELVERLSHLNGIKSITGRMSSYVKAKANFLKPTENDREGLEKSLNVDSESGGTPEDFWFLSYDNRQLKWAQEYLVEGTCDESVLNEKNGVIAVRSGSRENKQEKALDIKLYDKVSVQTKMGTKEFTIMGIMDSVPYSADHLTLATLITTEDLFHEITNDTLYKSLDIRLNHKNQKQTINKIESMLDKTLTFHDNRQLNSEAKNAYMTIAVFIYGFTGVIAFISLLNIINTMNTSIVSKMKYLGVMRAVGMSGKQLNRMVFAQSITYSIMGCIAGTVFGIFLQVKLLAFLGSKWTFPFYQILAVFVFCILSTVLSVRSPLAVVRKRGISETISLL